MRLSYFKKTAVGLALGVGLVQFAQAQAVTPDATVNIQGSITANTCSLQLSDGTTTVNNTQLNVDFGKLALPTTVSAVGTGLGSSKTLTFTTRNASNTGACVTSTAAGEKTNFNVLLGLTNANIQTIGTATYVKNAQAGGTNAVLALGRGSSVTTTAPLGLTPNSGTVSGTYAANIGGVPIGGTTPGFIQLTAQLATSLAAVPTAGIFTANIPLFLVYQ